jgi:hypothetical protein
MKPETLKKLIDKLTWEDLSKGPSLPMSQGLVLQEVIKRYKMPAKEVGYNNGSDIVAVKTNKQILVWRDTGVGATFLGIMDRETGEITIKEDDRKPVEHPIFPDLKSFYAEIDKRDYNNILGLKAKITLEKYMDALECMPPLKYVKDGFILREALTDGLYTQFTHVGKLWETGTLYYAEVVKLEDETIMQLED